MENDKKSTEKQDNSLAHLTENKQENKPATYDPDRYLTNEGDAEEGKPLEEQEPDKGYSTKSRQGKPAASLHLADEDMDKRLENPEAKGQDLQESFEKSKENSNLEKAKEVPKEEKNRQS